MAGQSSHTVRCMLLNGGARRCDVCARKLYSQRIDATRNGILKELIKFSSWKIRFIFGNEFFFSPLLLPQNWASIVVTGMRTRLADEVLC